MNIKRNSKFVSVLFLTLTLTGMGGCASQGPPEQSTVTGPEKSVSGYANDINEIVIDIPVGSVNVVALPGSRVSANLEVLCDKRNKSCVRLAETVMLKQQVFENRMYLSPSTRSKFAFRKSQCDYQIQVPENIPVRIIMGYGSLSVKGLRSDLTIGMSAGEVHVEAPRSAVRRVWADANFGDASLHGTESGREGDRRFLVGAEADWQEGTGEHAIIINLNAGDISVKLSPW